MLSKRRVLFKVRGAVCFLRHSRVATKKTPQERTMFTIYSQLTVALSTTPTYHHDVVSAQTIMFLSNQHDPAMAFTLLEYKQKHIVTNKDKAYNHHELRSEQSSLLYSVY
jgi:hypothetical protein